MKQPMDTQAMNSVRFLLLLMLVAVAPGVHAHGTRVAAAPNGDQIMIDAKYDTGEPMSDAQILIYAPDDPQSAWDKGIADETGQYQFAIDDTLTGDWSINIRTAGHGQWVYLTLNDDGTISFEADERPAWLTWAIAGVVVAGLVGVAAWSMKRPRNQAEVIN